tara:strand:- start:89 stop:601 length:513 start_codon:yes stop_codon:yes gene_type:complete
MKPILVLVTIVCGILMIGGLVGYTYEDEITDITVPPVNQVGFADDPLTESAIPAALINAELTIEWDEDVWVGLITQDEFERCVPSNGLSSVCGGESSVNFAAGGPDSKDAQTFTHEISGDVYYPVDGGAGFGAGTSVDVQYSVKVTFAWPVTVFLGLLGSGCLTMAQRMN